MDDEAFDQALVGAWFALTADSGRDFPSVAAAAREAGLPVERARVRFPSRASVLLRFGRLADQAALTGALTEGAIRDRLFDVVMRRIDQMQAHRAGVAATLRRLPANPPLALLLGLATERSMRWMLDACGIGTAGLAGALRVRGLVLVWLYTVRAWERDDSADLSATMAALDRALAQAERAAGFLAPGGAASGGAAAGGTASAPVGPASAPPADAVAPDAVPPGTGGLDQPGLEPSA